MFVSLFLFALVIFSLINVSNIGVLQLQKNTADLVSATSAFYATESNIEDTLYEFKKGKEENSLSFVKSFIDEKRDEGKSYGKKDMGTYSISVVRRDLNLLSEKLTKSTPKAFDEFRFLDTHEEYLFNELEFSYEYPEDLHTDKGLVLDLIVFPRPDFLDTTDTTQVNFGTLKTLSTKQGDFSKNVKRMSFHTLASLASNLLPAGESFKDRMNFDSDHLCCLSTTSESKKTELKCNEHTWYCSITAQRSGNTVTYSGLSPKDHNYILRYQTLGRDPVFTSVSAKFHSIDLPISSAQQTLEIDSETAVLNMYQRVKKQQRSFSPLQPGLDFVLFSDNTLSK
jgi:hypothetical protein